MGVNCTKTNLGLHAPIYEEKGDVNRLKEFFYTVIFCRRNQLLCQQRVQMPTHINKKVVNLVKYDPKIKVFGVYEERHIHKSSQNIILITLVF